MSASPSEGVELIWATRGRTWGFRFLLDGGLSDPLFEYERVFFEAGAAEAWWHRSGDAVAVRFPDPKVRRDAAGRVIPHEFVVFGDTAAYVASVEDALRLIWPIVDAVYDRVWDAEAPPSPEQLGLTP